MNLDEALIQYQYDDAQPLPFNFIPNRLVNEKYCNSLSTKVLKICSGKWEKLTATPGLADSLPDKPGIYMFVWRTYFPFIFDDSTSYIKLILYIGKSGELGCNGTLKSRYKGEYSKIVKSNSENIWKISKLNSRKERLDKFLNLYELEYWFIVMDNCDNLSDILKLEDELIKLFNPPANKKGIRMKYSTLTDAF
ncbi:MAG: hypothetical protein AB1568_02395 [Thermodesulfobacteriota bacterium]